MTEYKNNEFEKLMKTALKLEAHKNTEWAEENAMKYDLFATMIETLWGEGILTDEEHDALALVAFYDYDDMKCDEEDMSKVYALMP